MRASHRSTVAAVACLIGVLVVGVCVALGRDRVTSYPPDWPHRAPWKLTREILLPSERQIRFIVDVRRGLQPKREGLDHLVEIASKYSEQSASWVLAGSPDAPDFVWVLPETPNKPVKVVYHGSANPTDLARDLPGDAADSIRYFREIPSCPADMPDVDTTYVFVRFLGKWGSQYGAASTVEGAPECAGRQFHVIYLAQDQIALRRPPSFSRAFLEMRALAHEYGHVLGLATNPTHGGWIDTINYRGGAHCVNRECAVSIPSPKALLRGLMLDYCHECQRDIQQARSHWLDGVGFPEAVPLAQPDPAAIVARLKDYQFRPGAEASKLTSYGKFVMPSLIERMARLRGNKYGSPRYSAAQLVLEMIVEEDRARRTEEHRYFSRREGDHSDALLEWWSREGETFMNGDAWSLPESVLVVSPGSP